MGPLISTFDGSRHPSVSPRPALQRRLPPAQDVYENGIGPAVEHAYKRMAKFRSEQQAPDKQHHGQKLVGPGAERPLSFPEPHRVLIERTEIEDRPQVFRRRPP